MKKRLKFLVAMVFATLLSANVFAYDFVVNGIYYNINSDDTTVSVTYENTSYNSYSGNVTIPSTVTYNGTTYSVTSIGYAAFYNSIGLTSVTIPNSVTSISKWAFGYCTSLTSVTIPNSVTSIGSSALSKCTGLTSITIPNSVTSIGRNALDSCINLTSVDIPNSISIIDTAVFRFCTGLTSVTIPNSVTSIGSTAFMSCTGLTSVTIPNSITTIEWGTFAGCTGLTSVTIPNSVTTIEWAAFDECTSLTTINYNAVNCSGGGFVGSYTHWLIGCNNITTVNIGDSVQTIPPYFMYQKSSLTSVTIPNSVTSIGSSAFSDCTGLTSVTIGNSVTTIGEDAFRSCTGLTSVSIPNSVTTIGNGAFNYCTGLTSVTIPNSVTSIESYTFSHCSGLTSVTIPNSVTSIGYAAFRYCSGLTSVTIPNSVTSIESYTFSDCTSLTSITIPNSVTSIGESAFSHCTSLDIVTIGSGVTEIRDNAFGGCGSLDTIYSMPAVPPTIYSNTFNNVYRGIPLYVPCGTLEDYSSATYWREFSNIQEYCESGSVVVETREATDITDTTATLNGEITIAGNPEILAQGFEWKEQNASSYNVVNVSGTILTEVLTGLTPNTTYTYRAFATTSNGTQYGEDIVFTTLLNSGIDDIEKENTIAVYPNPAKENITLRADEDIFIYSNLGQIVKQVNNPKGEITINVSDLQKGVYYIKTGNRQQKLIINK